jgi:hypothetical protein
MSRNYDAAFGTIPGINEGFRRIKQNLSIYLLFDQAAGKFKYSNRNIHLRTDAL